MRPDRYSSCSMDTTSSGDTEQLNGRGGMEFYPGGSLCPAHRRRAINAGELNETIKGTKDNTVERKTLPKAETTGRGRGEKN